MPKTKPLSLRVTQREIGRTTARGHCPFVETIRAVLIEVVLHRRGETAHADRGENACRAADIGQFKTGDILALRAESCSSCKDLSSCCRRRRKNRVRSSFLPLRYCCCSDRPALCRPLDTEETDPPAPAGCAENVRASTVQVAPPSVDFRMPWLPIENEP